jgi:flagellar protein FlaI
MKTGEVTLFDLVKTSLRYRPDYIIVGEIRGEEAFVLFQALATGHGGLTTLHAESLEYAVKRLTSPPMNVSETYIPLINAAAIQERVQLPKPRGDLTFGRRLKSVVEIVDYENYRTVASWNPSEDAFRVDLDQSEMLKRIAGRNGASFEEVLEELNRRALMLRNLAAKGVNKNVEVAKNITNYYLENQFPTVRQASKRRVG